MIKYLYILILLSSCYKEIEIDIQPHEEKLVVNSLVLSGLPIEVHLSSSKIMQDTLIPLDTEALVIIKDDEVHDTLKYIGYGKYKTRHIIAEDNNAYFIEVHKSKYNSVFAADVIPEQVDFEIISFKERARIDAEGYEYSEFEISFNDNINIQNYYEIGLVSDDLYGLNKHYLYSDNVAVLNEGDAEFYPQNILLSDELFNGKNMNIKIYTDQGDYQTEFYIYFRSISETYYKYKKKLIRHIENQYNDMWYGSTNPVVLFSNIQNGYGIFAGYSEQIDTIKIKEWKK